VLNVLKSGSLNPPGLSRPVMGLLYLFIPNIYGLRMEIKVTSYFELKTYQLYTKLAPPFSNPPHPQLSFICGQEFAGKSKMDVPYLLEQKKTIFS